MLTLGIIDKIKPEDLTGGKIIAGTGTIDAMGNVGPIGGIPQKLVGGQGRGRDVLPDPGRQLRRGGGQRRSPGCRWSRCRHARRGADRAGRHPGRPPADTLCPGARADRPTDDGSDAGRSFQAEPVVVATVVMRSPLPRVSRRGKVTIACRRRCPVPVDLLDQVVDLWTDWLWFDEVGYTNVFGGCSVPRSGCS